MRGLLCLAALAAPLLAAPAFADADPPFVTGRPGQTESPISVPKGDWQVESELAGYARGGGAESWSAAATTLRYGIAHGADMELVVAPYLRSRADGETTDGFGDVSLRARRTFFGEDGGPAFALIGYVTLPTSRDGLGADKVEGGLIATGVVDLSERTNLTLTIGAAAIHDGAYEGDVSAGAALGYAFTDRLSGYVELFGERAAFDEETAATFDVGGAYLLNDVTQLDAGINLALTDAADDATVFLGWSHRF